MIIATIGIDLHVCTIDGIGQSILMVAPYTLTEIANTTQPIATHIAL